MAKPTISEVQKMIDEQEEKRREKQENRRAWFDDKKHNRLWVKLMTGRKSWIEFSSDLLWIREIDDYTLIVKTWTCVYVIQNYRTKDGAQIHSFDGRIELI